MLRQTKLCKGRLIALFLLSCLSAERVAVLEKGFMPNQLESKSCSPFPPSCRISLFICWMIFSLSTIYPADVALTSQLKHHAMQHVCPYKGHHATRCVAWCFSCEKWKWLLPSQCSQWGFTAQSKTEGWREIRYQWGGCAECLCWCCLRGHWNARWCDCRDSFDHFVQCSPPNLNVCPLPAMVFVATEGFPLKLSSTHLLTWEVNDGLESLY